MALCDTSNECMSESRAVILAMCSVLRHLAGEMRLQWNTHLRASNDIVEGVGAVV